MGFRVKCEKCGQVHYTDQACPSGVARALAPAYLPQKESVLAVEAVQPSNPDAEVQLRIGNDPDICPTCGQRTRPKTNAERQRAYRERKRSEL